MNRFVRTLSAVLGTLSAVLGTLSGYSVTATKEYVDRQDASTLQAAKDYTDAHGAGGVDTNAVIDIAAEVVAPVASNVLSHTSLLSQLSQDLTNETTRAMAAERDAEAIAVSEAYNAIHKNNDAEFNKVTLSSDVTTPVVDAGVVQANVVRVTGKDGLFAVGPSVNIVVSGDREFSDYGLPMISEWARAVNKPTYTYGEIGGTFPGITAHQSLKPATNYTDTAIAAETTRATAAESALSNTVNAWQTYWDGDDVRLTVTNYFGKADLPRLYIEQRTNEVAMATNLYKVIWDEGTRLAPITNDLAGLAADLAALDEAKADRDWGRYDSHTGGAAPAGYTSVSSPGIVLGAGLAWQNVGLNDGEVWVLTANDPQTVTVAESGTFAFHDADGRAMIEIVKGDRRVVGATVSSVDKTDSTFEITFNVVSAEHPTIYAATNLVGAVWHEEGDAQFPGSVTWSGQSGAWVATVGNIAAYPQLFFRGVYEIGGESYVKIVGERCDPGEIGNRLGALENALGDIDAALSEILGVNNEP